MKHNGYSSRRQQRYEIAQTPPVGKKLIEQFLTQVVVCALLIILIIGVQLLGFRQIDSRINRIKVAIAYSPSLDEMTQSAKDALALIINRVNLKDKSEEITPVISIDNDVF